MSAIKNYENSDIRCWWHLLCVESLTAVTLCKSWPTLARNLMGAVPPFQHHYWWQGNRGRQVVHERTTSGYAVAEPELVPDAKPMQVSWRQTTSVAPSARAHRTRVRSLAHEWVLILALHDTESLSADANVTVAHAKHPPRLPFGKRRLSLLHIVEAAFTFHHDCRPWRQNTHKRHQELAIAGSLVVWHKLQLLRRQLTFQNTAARLRLQASRDASTTSSLRESIPGPRAAPEKLQLSHLEPLHHIQTRTQTLTPRAL